LLTTIKGYCSLMLEGTYGAVNLRMEEIINRIIFSNDRLVNLVENLLSVSRIEAGRMAYELEPHHIEDIIAELATSFTTKENLDRVRRRELRYELHRGVGVEEHQLYFLVNKHWSNSNLKCNYLLNKRTSRFELQ
jgi:K+-sensing histidine kinase KdpD